MPRKPAKPTISIVGPGRLGSALALALHEAGYTIEELIARDAAKARALARKVSARAVTLDGAALSSDILWLTVGDSAIRSCAESLAARGIWRGKIVFHSSGALASNELIALRDRGATVASLHPLMTFSRGTRPSLHNVTFAIEGERRAVSAARLIAGSLGGNPIQITPERKAAYHAFGAFGSPLLIALLAAAEQVARSAGLSPNSARRAIAPLVKQTVENYIAKGGASAFTGPLVRGDVDTVRKHLKALGTDSAAKDAYLALANAAMKYLPVTNAEQIASVLNKRQH